MKLYPYQKAMLKRIREMLEAGHNRMVFYHGRQMGKTEMNKLKRRKKMGNKLHEAFLNQDENNDV